MVTMGYFCCEISYFSRKNRYYVTKLPVFIFFSLTLVLLLPGVMVSFRMEHPAGYLFLRAEVQP